MLEDSFSDNIRQTKVIMKYELRKHLEGKKIILFGMLMALLLALNIILPYILGDGLNKDPTELAYSFVTFASLLILISATLFASGTIVSEFEERTALILFTKPLRKWSIFLGKFVSACLLGIMFMLIYYAVVVAVSFAVTGTIATNLLLSLGLAILYVIATTGIAVLISSAVKKASTAAILTFVMLLMIFALISMLLDANSIDPWFMVNQAELTISSCLSGEDFNALASAAVMVVWGAATGVVGYTAFKRREF